MLRCSRGATTLWQLAHAACADAMVRTVKSIEPNELVQKTSDHRMLQQYAKYFGPLTVTIV